MKGWSSASIPTAIKVPTSLKVQETVEGRHRSGFIVEKAE